MDTMFQTVDGVTAIAGILTGLAVLGGVAVRVMMMVNLFGLWDDEE